MSTWSQTLGVVIVASSAFAASAQPAAEHAQHHPPATVVPQAAPVDLPTGTSSMPPMRQQMHQHMATMQALRARMAAAGTPAEREALMAEHGQAMQQGMEMMKSMGGMGGMQGHAARGAMAPDPAQRHQLLEMRMDMMQNMMEMLMQRLPSPPAGPGAR